MEEQQRIKIKQELKEELSKELQNTIEDEVEEEVKEQHMFGGSLFFSKFKGSFLTFLAIIIALGEYSEAVTVLGDTVETIRSEFTNDIEYETISKIHVGNTVPYMEELLGSPQVSRAINQDINANYYYDEKFLLTLFIDDERVTAFTVLPLLEDFHPEVATTTKGPWNLGEAAFTSFPANPQTYVIDHAKTASYYLENLDRGRAGLFVNTYLGKVSYTVRSESPLLVAFYNQEVHGSDQEVLESQTQLRNSEMPNFYGEGEIGLELIEKSILTGAEFSSYFGQF